MLLVLHMKRTLRLTRPGRLLPWLGPALRGLVARRFKAHVCRHTQAEQETTWIHCKGCPHMASCPYGLLVEPDPPPAAPVFRGQEDAARPLVLAPGFPVPGLPREGYEIAVDAGLEIPVSATFIGLGAAGLASYLWEAVRAAGRDPDAGFDPEHTTFDLLPQPPNEAVCWRAVELPPHPESISEIVSRVRVTLTAPLFLRARDDQNRRHEITQPTFADLLRASLRAVGSLCALYDQPLEADFAALKAASYAVPLVEDRYRRFRQPKTSARSGPRMLYGVVGEGVYGDVPAALLSWLAWGGLLGVGAERMAGAGGWSVARAQCDTSARGDDNGWHVVE